MFGGTYGQYTVRFNGHILFHSVPYTETSKDALKEGEYNLLGEPASQGCVRLSVIDAKWIYDNCRKGTKVEVYDSPDPGPLGKPSTYQIDPDSPFRGWDPTDPDPENPWKTGDVSIFGVKDITINQGEEIDLLSGVSAVDVDGLSLEVEVDEVDVNVPGEYTISYSATGVLGDTETETATLTIIAIEPPVSEDTEMPGNTEMPGGTETPDNTQTPGSTQTPGGTETPGNTQTPGGTETPGNTETPGSTQTPGGTETPGNTETPGGTETPGSTETPGNTETPDNTQTPDGTELPGDTEIPDDTEDVGDTESSEDIQSSEDINPLEDAEPSENNENSEDEQDSENIQQIEVEDAA